MRPANACRALPRKTTRLLTFPKNKTNIQNKQTNKRFVFTLLLYGANWAAVRLSIRMVTDTMKAPGATLQAVAVASGEGRGGAAAQLSVAGHARSRSSAGEGPPCRSLVDALEDELPQNGARPSLAKRHSIGDAIGKCPSAPLEPVRSPLRAHAASQLSQSFANVTAVASSMAGRGPQREEDVRRTFSLDGEEVQLLASPAVLQDSRACVRACVRSYDRKADDEPVACPPCRYCGTTGAARSCPTGKYCFRCGLVQYGGKRRASSRLAGRLRDRG